MKKIISVAIALMVLSSCTSIDKEYDGRFSLRNNQISRFYATIEQCDQETKVYADEDLKVLWNAGDFLSVFNQRTYNSKFEFKGEDGDNAGDFEDVTPSGLHSGNALDNVYAVYPYASGNKINNAGNTITLTLPAEQQYKAHSFGIGANTMVAVTDDSYLAFKNLCGYLQLRLFGDNVKVSSIKIQGNNGEKIAGKANVAVGLGTLPNVTMDDTATDAITLVCDPPVEIGATADNYTDFWFVIPPTTFSGGFTITVTDELGGVFEKTTMNSLTIARSTIEYMRALQVIPTHIITVNKYLTFTSEWTTTVHLYNRGGNAPLLYYSTDAINWVQWDYSELTFTSSSPLYICGDNPDGFSSSITMSSSFATSGSNFIVHGDIMSLINKDEDIFVIPNDYCFRDLFQRCKGLLSAPELPATELKKGCYSGLFWDCSSLTETPELPATVLANSCYSVMFAGCTCLTSAPELPATTLANSCYYGMFRDCSSLTAGPALPATVLATGCYQDMFQRCSFTSAPELPATTLVQSCYSSMFYGCSNLSTAPELPATSLAQSCYLNMFYGCSNLSTAPELPATTLANACYYGMFEDCSSLTNVPELPAMTLANQCYQYMFAGCTNLSAAPQLPATKLSWYCYESMFEGCTSLTAAPELPSTSLSVGCYSGMFSNCTSLTSAPELPATRAEGYSSMFAGCTSLITAPELPATTLTKDCYHSMFKGCISLTTAPELSAMTLAEGCYASMFEGCTSLASAPELPALSVANSCYSGMFRGCSNLISAPELPAAVIALSCYNAMFENCSNLNYVKCLAISISGSACTNWLNGVSSEGTFIKAENMTSWTTGASGIPAGWAVVDDSGGGIAINPGKYLTFTSDGTTTITLDNYGGNAPLLYYSYDQTDWKQWNYSGLTFNATTPLFICGDNPEGFSSSYEVYSKFTSKGDAFTVSGDVMSLIEYKDDIYKIPCAYCFIDLFDSTSITIAPELPATILAEHCYHSMFRGCSSLTTAPELPATILAEHCYHSMFSACQSLTTAPELPAMTLAPQCYQSMFDLCVSLAVAPELPANILANACYKWMFEYSGLTLPPSLPTTFLAESCYEGMFRGCLSLLTAPELPATSLLPNCYKDMFEDCPSLNYVKCMATDINLYYYTYNWLNGVSSTGTFVKETSTTWPVGESGIPYGWTVLNEGDSLSGGNERFQEEEWN